MALLAFAFFGLGGYLFYAFLYGAMGALVSKTEDISKSSAGLALAYQSLLRISFSAVPILIGLPYRSVPMRYSFAPNTPVPMMDNTSIRKDNTICQLCHFPPDSVSGIIPP